MTPSFDKTRFANMNFSGVETDGNRLGQIYE